MATIGSRIVQLLQEAGECLDDDEMASRLGGLRRQTINQEARRLAAAGAITRLAGPGGKLVNCPSDGPAGSHPQPHARPQVAQPAGGLLTEDEVKRALLDHLESQGYMASVKWGHERGVDIEAVGTGGRILIEAKGEVARQPQQANYFLGALGELVQRMSDPDAEYGLALPDNRQYRGLVARLSAYAIERLKLRVYFVKRSGSGYRVDELDYPS